MLIQLLVGGVASAVNITIHALVMAVVVRAAQTAGAKPIKRSSLRLAGIMIVTVVVLKAAHISEVIVWALTYRIVDAVPADTGFFYFAFVNYTTLGYGDVLPAPDWLLLGPITAMTGILLFGWSTAVIFEVLRRAMGR
jgi:hypothetical protein